MGGAVASKSRRKYAPSAQAGPDSSHSKISPLHDESSSSGSLVRDKDEPNTEPEPKTCTDLAKLSAPVIKGLRSFLDAADLGIYTARAEEWAAAEGLVSFDEFEAEEMNELCEFLYLPRAAQRRFKSQQREECLRRKLRVMRMMEDMEAENRWTNNSGTKAIGWIDGDGKANDWPHTKGWKGDYESASDAWMTGHNPETSRWSVSRGKQQSSWTDGNSWMSGPTDWRAGGWPQGQGQGQEQLGMPVNAQPWPMQGMDGWANGYGSGRAGGWTSDYGAMT